MSHRKPRTIGGNGVALYECRSQRHGCVIIKIGTTNGDVNASITTADCVLFNKHVTDSDIGSIVKTTRNNILRDNGVAGTLFRIDRIVADRKVAKRTRRTASPVAHGKERIEDNT